MQVQPVKPHRLTKVLEAFPENAATIRSLSLSNQAFRGLCEDLALACEMLTRFEARSDANLRPEIPEYKSLINLLENEIAAYLATADQR